MQGLALVLNTHNRRADIKRSLMHIRSMDYIFSEIHVINDSRDEDYIGFVKTVFDAASVGARHFRLHHTHGLGGVGARLYGAQQVKSDYISFWDDDDVLRVKYFEEVLQHFTSNPDTKVITTNYVRVFNRGWKRIIKGDLKEIDILGENKVGGFSFISITRDAASLLSEVPLELKAGQDWFFYYLILRQYGLNSLHRLKSYHLYYNDKVSESRITSMGNVGSLRSLAWLIQFMNDKGERFRAERFELLQYRIVQGANLWDIIGSRVNFKVKLIWLRYVIKRLLP